MPDSPLSVDVGFAREYVATHLDKRQVNKIQHGFPSPRFWTETAVPVDEINADRRALGAMGRNTGVNLYLGIPYCLKTSPGKCGYCLFPVEDFVGNSAIDAYFEYLKRETAMYAEAMEGQTLASVYFGGGTSNLYKPAKYMELMDLVRSLFPTLPPEADITLEGIPQLFTREKIEAFKAAGMNRVSMGVQQVNERLNKLSGRAQTTKHVVQTLEWCREFGLSCNVDLIFGWPQQTVATMVEDLEKLVEWGVYDITHYELNVGGPTDFSLNRFHELPSPLSNLEMYRAARELLESHGYVQMTAYNWRKPGDPFGQRFEECSHGFEGESALGLGYAGITFFTDALLDGGRSWSLINWRNLDQYKACIEANRFPVECGFRHSRADQKVMSVFYNLLGMELDRASYQAAFATDVYDDFAGVWDALAEWELVSVTPERIRLAGDGAYYTPMIQALLAERRYRDLRAREAERPREPALTAGA